MSYCTLKPIKKDCGCFASSNELTIDENMSEDKRYNDVIKDYKDTHSESDKHLLDVKKAATIEIAIKLAATGRDAKGHKHRHQNLIPSTTLEMFSDEVLMRKNEIASATSFKQLHGIVQSCRIKGIGELCIYDTTERIGTFLGVFPDEVYLHRGTRIGAVRLLGKVKKNRLDKKDFPFPFQRDDLSCAEIEDILCIYKDKF